MVAFSMADQMTTTSLPTPADDAADALVALGRLREDPDPAVRGEVAEALEAMARTHPTVVLATAQRWLAEGGPHTRTVVGAALRVLSRSGDDGARRLLGFAPEVAVRVRDVTLESKHVRTGESLRIQARVVSAETRKVAVAIDVAIDGGRPSVVTTRRIGALESVDVRLVLPLRSDGARPGPHTLTIRINGRIEATVDFTVVM
jgi:hypothetical protein